MALCRISDTSLILELWHHFPEHMFLIRMEPGRFVLELAKLSSKLHNPRPHLPATDVLWYKRYITFPLRVANALSSLLARLRAATHHDHYCLDRHPRLSRLLECDLDRKGYADALASLYGAQSSLEDAVRLGLEQLVVSSADIDGYRLDARAPALHDDLARLGANPNGCPVTPLAAPERLETLVGLLYVLEGSRLGARVIARHVRASLGAAAPLRFLAEADGAAHWADFRAFAECATPKFELSEHVLAERQSLAFTEEAAHGARAAFALFRHSLDVSPAIMTLGERIALATP